MSAGPSERGAQKFTQVFILIFFKKKKIKLLRIWSRGYFESVIVTWKMKVLRVIQDWRKLDINTVHSTFTTTGEGHTTLSDNKLKIQSLASWLSMFTVCSHFVKFYCSLQSFSLFLCLKFRNLKSNSFLVQQLKMDWIFLWKEIQ